MLTLGFSKGNLRNASHHWFNDLMANPRKPHHKKPSGPSQDKVVAHHILLNKGERIDVGNVVGLIRKRITLIPLSHYHQP
jgi:hypothetical protein